ncbi:hypothetical protein D9M69_553690 [compost metagenome]
MADHRQRVDEQPHLLLDADQFRRTPRHRGTEGHGRLAGIALQQQQPGSLDQGVHRHPMRTGELAKATRLLLVEDLAMIAMTHLFF